MSPPRIGEIFLEFVLKILFWNLYLINFQLYFLDSGICIKTNFSCTWIG